MTKIDLSALEAKWPSPYVARTEVHNFSGGILNERTIANLDSQGAGPPGRIRCGRKIAYPVKELVGWMEGRSTSLDE